MDINVLLNKMSTDIGSLSMTDKLLGSLFVTVLSMLIVFAVLQLLIWLLQLMNKLLNRPEPLPAPSVVAAPAPTAPQIPVSDPGELIAVLSAAVAASVGHQVRVVGVRRLHDDTPVWARVGRGDHLIPEHHTPHK